MKKRSITCALCLLIPAVCLFPAAPDGNAAAQESEKIVFSADAMTGSASSSSEYTKLSGNAYIRSSSLEVYADVIELSGKDFRFIAASGGVRGKDLESGFDFTCTRLTYDREKKTAILDGSVTLTDTENDVTALAGRIEYDQNTEIAVMQIDVKITQKETVCTASFAVYRRGQKMLELMGNPQVTRGKDVFRGQEIRVNLDTEEITLEGNVRGTVVDTSGEEKK